MSEALMMYLARKIGRGNAYNIVERAINRANPDDTLRDIILKDPQLQPLVKDDLDALLEPASYIGFAPQMVDEAVKLVNLTTN